MRLDELSVTEMLELAKNGAQVLNARSVELARDKNVSVRVRSTFNPHDSGTLVSDSCRSQRAFTGVSLNKKVNCIEFQLEKLEMGKNRTLRALRQARARTKVDLLKMLASAGIEAEIITAYRPNPFKIHFKVQKSDTLTAVATLHKASLPVREITVNSNMVSIVLVGTGITTKHEEQALAIMLQQGIPVHAISHCKQVLSLYVDTEYAERGLKEIHSSFTSTPEWFQNSMIGNGEFKVIAS